MDSCWRSFVCPLPLRVGMVMQEERWRGRKRSSSVLLHSILLPLVFWLQQQFVLLPYLLVYESFPSSLFFPAFPFLLSLSRPYSIFPSHSMASFIYPALCLKLQYMQFYTCYSRKYLTVHSCLVCSHWTVVWGEGGGVTHGSKFVSDAAFGFFINIETSIELYKNKVIYNYYYYFFLQRMC